MNVKVLLADDHPIVRQGLRRLLEAEDGFIVVAEAGDGLEAIQVTERTKPDVLVVDLMMPGLNGLEVTRQVKRYMPNLRVIILSMHQDDAYVIQALRNGASGYVHKDSSPTELAHAIREVHLGERYLSARLNRELIDPSQQMDIGLVEDDYELLTDRERQVFHLVVEGCTAGEIAQRLSISPRTAEAHRANLMRKLNLTSLLELVRFAIKRGILPLEQ